MGYFYLDPLLYCYSIEILPDKLGEGEFGEVHEARLRGNIRGKSFSNTTVAVKRLKGNFILDIFRCIFQQLIFYFIVLMIITLIIKSLCPRVLTLLYKFNQKLMIVLKRWCLKLES